MGSIPAVLRRLGVDPTEVLAEVGLNPTIFEDPDNTMSAAARGHLLSLCVSRTECSHFGLLVGQQGGLSSLGLVGLLVQHSPDVGTALHILERHFRIRAQGTQPTLTVQDESALLGFAIYQPGAVAADQIADGAIAIEFNIMRELCGPDWRPTEVLLAHREPKNVVPFRRFFRARLCFDAEQNALVFPANWLGRRLPGEDPGASSLLQRQIDSVEVKHPEDFAEQVRRVLRTALLLGQPRAAKVGSLFAMHSRTLNRRLHVLGTSFQELVDDGRFEIARQMLEYSRMNVSQIAGMLSYSEPSAFTRAFRRWSGSAPQQWRRDHARLV
jgi:AraC-like DNA-binding protein